VIPPDPRIKRGAEGWGGSWEGRCGEGGKGIREGRGTEGRGEEGRGGKELGEVEKGENRCLAHPKIILWRPL
jgi:hypothetical protein